MQPAGVQAGVTLEAHVSSPSYFGHPPAICLQKSDVAGRLDAFLVLDFSFDGLSGVTGLKLKGDGLASQGLHKYLHL